MNQLGRDPQLSRASELATRLALPNGTDPRTDDPTAIWSFAMDGCIPVCMTLDMLDEWWRSKSPQEKAEIWDRSLETNPQDQAEEIISLALAAAQHPLNVIVAQAERIAASHTHALNESAGFIQGRLHRCRQQQA